MFQDFELIVKNIFFGIKITQAKQIDFLLKYRKQSCSSEQIYIYIYNFGKSLNTYNDNTQYFKHFLKNNFSAILKKMYLFVYYLIYNKRTKRTT